MTADTIALMPRKTAHLQIRLTPGQKTALRKRALAAGVDVSSYVLARALPPSADRVAEALTAVTRAPSDGERRLALAALHDALMALPGREAAEAWQVAPQPAPGDAVTANLIAAMVEQRAQQLGLAPPAWARWTPPLEQPWFATDLRGLRAHLLRASPVLFRRRNLYVDASLGARV
jgi:uncharacterized protein (DUF1778 family)